MTAALAGLRVWSTRPAPHDEASAAAWRERGADVLSVPTVHIVPRDLDPEVRARIDVLDEAWIVLPSPRAAENLARTLGIRRADGSVWPCATVGRATSESARTMGFDVRLQAGRATGADLGVELLAAGAPEHLVLASSDRRREELGRVLREGGKTVIDVTVHRTEPVEGLPTSVREGIEAGTIDVIAVYSPSALEFVRGLDARTTDRLRRLLVACLGNTTADTARALGFTRVVAPDAPGETAMIETVVLAL